MSHQYRYNASTLNPDAYIDQLNREIRERCEAEPLRTDADKEKLLSLLLRRAGTAAYQGANRLEGGPFGAMLVDFHTKDGVPQVVGFGTNHVVPNSDPSAHAEMTAIRDAAKRLGRTDLSGLTLISSCECCPMCLSAATGCHVDKIYFAATREDAAKVGFSDEDQYRLAKAGGIEQHARRLDLAQAEALLAEHDAVVIVTEGEKQIAYYGDYTTAEPNDPTDLPVVQAIRKACRAHKVFHLPEDTLLISRGMPHPLSLITADWARIGRVRGANPDDPAQDHQKKDTNRILYLHDHMERMEIRAKDKTQAIHPQRIWQEIRNPSAVRVDKDLGHAHQIAFRKWDDLVTRGVMPRY